MAKRKAFTSAIDKVSNSQKPAAPEVKPEPKAVEKKTGAKETIVPKFSIEDAKEDKKKLEKKRVPVTLMMRPDLKDLLNNIADNRGVRLSAILEDVLLDYFKLPK